MLYVHVRLVNFFKCAIVIFFILLHEATLPLEIVVLSDMLKVFKRAGLLFTNYSFEDQFRPLA